MTVYLMTIILFFCLLLPEPFSKPLAFAALIVFGLKVPDHIENAVRKRLTKRTLASKKYCQCGQSICKADTLCRYCKLEMSLLHYRP